MTTVLSKDYKSKFVAGPSGQTRLLIEQLIFFKNMFLKNRALTQIDPYKESALVELIVCAKFS